MIEDIEYLQNNCEKDSSTIYVDSAERNYEFHPFPSEYSLQLAQPFKLVTGFDILDASIPTTMYNIDIYNKHTAFTVVRKAVTAQGTDERALFLEIAGSKIFSHIFEVAADTCVYVCNEVTQQTYGITEDKKISKSSLFASQTYVAIRRQIKNITYMYQYKSTNDPSLYYVTYNNKYYGVNKTDPIVDIFTDGNCYLEMASSGLFNLTYFSFYEVDSSTASDISSDLAYIATVNNYYKEIEVGNYDITTLRNDMNTIWNPYDIFFESTTTEERKQGKFLLKSSNYFVFNAKKSTTNLNLGFSALPLKSENTLYEALTIGKNNNIFASITSGSDNDLSYVIYSPGLINLLGDRFLILRCPEIEHHLNGSYAYMDYTPGIGMFKLAASYNDITNLRFDFVNLVKKPFHPIGKLAKMTFRFEISNGRLYDFKGINHQMLLVVKYLVPTQKFKFDKFILNPNYDANFMRYMAKAKSQQYKEDSDNEQEFDRPEYFERYKKEIEKYDYSSSDIDSQDEEDSDEDS